MVKRKNLKEIVAIIGIAVVMLCGAVGTGIINYNGDVNSGILGLTQASSFQKTLNQNGENTLSSQDNINVANAASKKYVGSWKSNVFHKKWCRYVKNIKKYNKRYFSSTKKAKRVGYRACKVCF
jgi:hypothetical protein